MSKTNLFDLDGKIAFVSGASRGIGEAIAKLLAQQGAHVIVSSRKIDDCQKVADAIVADGGKATLADVQALAHSVQTRGWRSVGDMRLLRRYERERKAALWPMGLAMDGLQQLFTRREAPLQALRNWGLKSLDRSPPLKHWMARQAMGTTH